MLKMLFCEWNCQVHDSCAGMAANASILACVGTAGLFSKPDCAHTHSTVEGNCELPGPHVFPSGMLGLQVCAPTLDSHSVGGLNPAPVPVRQALYLLGHPLSHPSWLAVFNILVWDVIKKTSTISLGNFDFFFFSVLIQLLTPSQILENKPSVCGPMIFCLPLLPRSIWQVCLVFSSRPTSSFYEQR